MKIVLVDPGYLLLGEEHFVSKGLIIIGTLLNQMGHQAQILDRSMCDGELSERSQWIPGIVKKIVSTQPEIVGFTTRCDTFPYTIRLLRALRGIGYNGIILLGGPQATVADIDTLEEVKEVDIIVLGEAEETMVKIVEYAEGHSRLESIPGIAYRNKGKVVRNAKGNKIGFTEYIPDYSVLPAESQRRLARIKAARVEVGRGCVHNCTYCCGSTIWGKQCRYRSIEVVKKEIEILRDVYGVNKIEFDHDDIAGDKILWPDILRQLCGIWDGIFKWGCSVRIDNICVQDIKLMKENGCAQVYFGIETGSARMQRNLKKYIAIDRIEENIEALNKNRISFIASFVCGHPVETIGDVDDTLDMAVNLRGRSMCKGIQIHKIAPVRGSRLYEEYQGSIYFNGDLSDQVNIELDECEKQMVVESRRLFSAHYSLPLDKRVEEIISTIEKISSIINAYPKTLKALRDVTGKAYVDIFSEINKLSIGKMVTEVDLATSNDKKIKAVYSIEAAEFVRQQMKKKKYYTNN